MVEVAKSEPVAHRRWRVPVVAAVIGAIAAFFWAINSVAVAPSAYPIADRVQKAFFFASILVALAWFSFAFYCRAVEWTRPASWVARATRREQLLTGLLCVVMGMMLVPNHLPEIVWLIDHHAWLRVLALAPYPLVVLYGCARIVQALIRDWRKPSLAA